MTPKAIQISVAEECPFIQWVGSRVPFWMFDGYLIEFKPTVDLNAMHAAETVLTDEQFREFDGLLLEITSRDYNQNSTGRMRDRAPTHTAAAQRTEAFLRAINKHQENPVVPCFFCFSQHVVMPAPEDPGNDANCENCLRSFGPRNAGNHIIGIRAWLEAIPASLPYFPSWVQTHATILDLCQSWRFRRDDPLTNPPAVAASEPHGVLAASRMRWRWLRAKTIACPWCKSERVRLEAWDGYPAIWQCCDCTTHFTYEPGPRDEPILPPTLLDVRAKRPIQNQHD